MCWGKKEKKSRCLIYRYRRGRIKGGPGGLFRDSCNRESHRNSVVKRGKNSDIIIIIIFLFPSPSCTAVTENYVVVQPTQQMMRKNQQNMFFLSLYTQVQATGFFGAVVITCRNLNLIKFFFSFLP